MGDVFDNAVATVTQPSTVTPAPMGQYAKPGPYGQQAERLAQKAATTPDVFDNAVSTAMGKAPAAPPALPSPTKPTVSPSEMVSEGAESEAQGNEQMAKEHPGLIAAASLAGAGPTAIEAALTHLGAFAPAAAEEAAAAPATEKVGTGLFDQYGDEIFKDLPVEAKSVAQKLASDPTVQRAMKSAVGKMLAEHLPEIASGMKWSAGALIGDKVLHWLFSGK